jgi:hypothetical protein
MTNSRSLRFLPSPQIGSTSPLRSSAKSKPRRLGRATSRRWQARFRRLELCLQVSSIFSARRRKLTDYRRYGLRCRAFHFPLRNLRRESDVQSVAKFESTTAFITEPNRKTSLSKAFPLFFPRLKSARPALYAARQNLNHAGSDGRPPSRWQARFGRLELCHQVSSIFSARRRKLTDYRRY